MLVTCALPYANGSIHLGHILEHIQADIWVRYQRMRGNNVYMVCADDTHGTPIMIKAKQLHMTPEEMITRIGRSTGRASPDSSSAMTTSTRPTAPRTRSSPRGCS